MSFTKNEACLSRKQLNFKITEHKLDSSLIGSKWEKRFLNRSRYRRQGKINEDIDNEIWKMWKGLREKRMKQKNKYRDCKERLTTRLIFESPPAHHNIKKQEDMCKKMLRKILNVDVTNKQLDNMKMDYYNNIRKSREGVFTLRKKKRKNAPKDTNKITEKSKFEEKKKNEKSKKSKSRKKIKNKKLNKAEKRVMNGKKTCIKEEDEKNLGRNCKQEKIKGIERSEEHTESNCR
ncbi:hypothetical protein L9F63_019432 [Diploptera punctata]|uniref:Uncharacterized protein n=1 Tax=Diploptera punctata TaxID=6984 RepID=A0AAD7ZUP0_DIPPU|nr:hypothetical protein L9F63_019432 [Diploptera punctata]